MCWAFWLFSGLQYCSRIFLSTELELTQEGEAQNTLAVKTSKGGIVAEKIAKLIVVPVDGSKNSLRSAFYLQSLFGVEYDFKIVLLHILRALPPILVEESINDSETANKLNVFQEKSILAGERILSDARDALMKQGFPEAAVETVLQKRQAGIARDICAWSGSQHADAIVISASGRSKLESFFMGEISTKLVDFCRVCPVWLVKGQTRNRNILLAIDNSANALRAADTAGFMLAGTTNRITLFHSKRQLTRFVASELVEAFPGLEERWKRTSSDHLAPYMQNAKEILRAAGIPERQLAATVIDGSRHAADDILKEAAKAKAGTIILGCKGHTDAPEYSMGSVAKKILNKAEDMTICLVP